MLRSLFAIALICASPTLASEARILNVVANSTGGGSWRFDVTIAHDDTGWDHYADGWEVLGPDRARLGFRELLHPHVDEQPFTRSLGGVMVPAGTSAVTIRVRDTVSGWAEQQFLVPLPGN